MRLFNIRNPLLYIAETMRIFLNKMVEIFSQNVAECHVALRNLRTLNRN